MQIPFNSIKLHSISEFKVIRHTSRTNYANMFIAYHIGSRAYVFVEEHLEYTNYVTYDVPRLIIKFGPHRHVAKCLGYTHLDGRCYFISQHYELGTLETQLIRYKTVGLSLTEDTLWSWLNTIMRTLMELGQVGLCSKITPKNILLEETVRQCDPELAYIDEALISRKARLNLLLSSFQTLEEAGVAPPRAHPDFYKASLQQALEGTRIADKTLQHLYETQKTTHQLDQYNPKYEAKSFAFTAVRPNVSSDYAIRRLQNEKIANLLNAQNVDLRLFKTKDLKAKAPSKYFETYLVGELKEILDEITTFLNSQSKEIGMLHQFLVNNQLEDAKHIILQRSNRTEETGILPIEQIMKARNASPVRQSSAAMAAFIREAKTAKIEDIHLRRDISKGIVRMRTTTAQDSTSPLRIQQKVADGIRSGILEKRPTTRQIPNFVVK